MTEQPKPTDPIAQARDFMIRAGYNSCGPIMREAEAADDTQRSYVSMTAAVTAYYATELLAALHEAAPQKATDITNRLLDELEWFDGSAFEMLADLARKHSIPEMQRRPFPATATVDDTEYDLTKTYRDTDGHHWRFDHWGRRAPQFVSTDSGVQIGSIPAYYVSSLTRLIAEHGPITPVEAPAPATA